MSSRLSEFLAGLKAEMPILIGVAPFGMIFGVLALDAGISPAQAQSMSWIVFAGSAQIVLTQLARGGAPALVMLLTVAVVNLRHVLYSASVTPYLGRLPPRWKWLLAYLLTDEAYAVSIIHYEHTQAAALAEGGAGTSADQRHWFFLGAGLALWGTWQASTAAGILLGAVVPAAWSLEFTLALTFIALVIPAIKDRAALAAALCAGLTAVLAHALTFKLGLILAAAVGVLAGMLVEGRVNKEAQP